jgi:hypothetical protein
MRTSPGTARVCTWMMHRTFRQRISRMGVCRLSRPAIPATLITQPSVVLNPRCAGCTTFTPSMSPRRSSRSSCTTVITTAHASIAMRPLAASSRALCEVLEAGAIMQRQTTPSTRNCAFRELSSLWDCSCGGQAPLESSAFLHCLCNHWWASSGGWNIGLSLYPGQHFYHAAGRGSWR